MAVVIETTLGDITVDLYLDQRPVTCLNFLKLCKMKYYNFNLFHSIRSGFIAQTGDPTGEGSGGESIWGILEGPQKRFFSGEKLPKIRHTDAGLISMVCTDDMMVGSQFFFTLAPDLDSLDGTHCVIGEVTEGREILSKLNEVICDETHRPYRDVRITHTVILEDPFSDPAGFRAPSRSPSPNPERLKGGRIAPDEEIDETQGKSAAEIQELIEEKEAKARATILEIVGDLPDADIAPPENVLFVCKLNPVTTDDDLEIIFSRFGKIVSCEVIRDKTSGNSLQYAFIEFEDKKSCENAYFKMDNVLIDDRRIHVDFSQSVSKMRWLGKGRGVQYFDKNGKQIDSKNTNKDNIKSLQEKDNQKHEHHTEKNKRYRRELDCDGDRNKKLVKDRADKEDRNKNKEDRVRSSKEGRNKGSNEDRDKSSKEGRDKGSKEDRDKSSKEGRDKGSKEDRHRSRKEGRGRSSKEDRDKNNKDDRVIKRSEKRDRSRSRHNSRDRIRNGEDRKYSSHKSDKNHHRNNNSLSHKNSSSHRSRSSDRREKESPSRKYSHKNTSRNDDEDYSSKKNKKDDCHKYKSKDRHYNKNHSVDKERKHRHNKEEKTPSPKKISKKKTQSKGKSKNHKVAKKPINKKKRKESTSSDSDSSESSSSSSDTSSSSESDHKKRRISRKRKHSSSTSSSSSDSSDTSSSSSSSSSSSTSSSSSDSDAKCKSKKVVDKKAKKIRKK